jgi:DNA repair protein RadD
VCLQHTGYARSLAEQFWRVLSNGTPVPRTVNEALQRQDELDWITHIRVAPEGDKYWRIIGYRINDENYDGNLNRAIAWGRPEINDSIQF